MAKVNRYVTTAGAGTKSGTSWGNAMDEAAFEASLEGTAVADYIYWIAGGTYTLDSSYDSSARDGSVTAPISIIGVKSGTSNVPPVYSDWARATADKPFFDLGAYTFKIGDYYKVRNISFQGSANITITTGVVCLLENCEFDNDVAGDTATYIVTIGEGSEFINNKVNMPHTNGVSAGNGALAGNVIAYNYFVGLGYGTAVLTGQYVSVFGNVFNRISSGVAMSLDGVYILQNTFYSSYAANYAVAKAGFVVMNNLVEGNTTYGFRETTQTDSNFYWGNHGDDARNGDMYYLIDTTLLHQDYANTGGDPLFVVAGSDFRIDSTSPCYGVANDINMGIG